MSGSNEISWMVLETGTKVVASDGEELGEVTTVVADDQKDIFSGVAFRPGLLGPVRFAPADLLAEITAEQVTLSIDSATANSLDEYEV